MLLGATNLRVVGVQRACVMVRFVHVLRAGWKSPPAVMAGGPIRMLSPRAPRPLRRAWVEQIPVRSRSRRS